MTAHRASALLQPHPAFSLPLTCAFRQNKKQTAFWLSAFCCRGDFLFCHVAVISLLHDVDHFLTVQSLHDSLLIGFVLVQRLLTGDEQGSGLLDEGLEVAVVIGELIAFLGVQGSSIGVGVLEGDVGVPGLAGFPLLVAQLLIHVAVHLVLHGQAPGDGADSVLVQDVAGGT